MAFCDVINPETGQRCLNQCCFYCWGPHEHTCLREHSWVPDQAASAADVTARLAALEGEAALVTQSLDEILNWTEEERGSDSPGVVHFEVSNEAQKQVMLSAMQQDIDDLLAASSTDAAASGASRFSTSSASRKREDADLGTNKKKRC